MAPGYVFQVSLRVTVQNQVRIAQRIIVDEVIQFRPLCYSHVQRILDPGAVNGDHSPIPEHIMATAITELVSFPSIPVKVTLDEYIDILDVSSMYYI